MFMAVLSFIYTRSEDPDDTVQQGPAIACDDIRHRILHTSLHPASQQLIRGELEYFPYPRAGRLKEKSKDHSGNFQSLTVSFIRGR